MIIWIDGPFGIGKSSVSNLLSEILPDSRVLEFDEYIYKIKPKNELEVFFGKCYPEGREYLLDALVQDINHILADNNSTNIIVPIALINDMCRTSVVEYFNNVTKVEHIILEASKENVVKRAEAQDGRDMNLVLTFFDEAKAYLDTNYTSAIRVDTNERSVEDIVDEIIIRIHR